MTCIQVAPNVVIDAGNILQGLNEKAQYIDHIFLSHTHLDHIVDIGFLADVYFDVRTKPITIYGLQGSIENLKKYLLNWEIWPDFSKIPLKNGGSNCIEFRVIQPNEEIALDTVSLKAIKTEHTHSSCGYVITKNSSAIFFTADTFKCQNIWDEVNSNLKIKSVITDVSFTSNMRKLAVDSKHLTPELLNEDVKKLKRKDVKIFVNHLKPIFIDKIKEEFNTRYPNLLNGGCVLQDGDTINIPNATIKANLSDSQLDKKHISQLIQIGEALTSEKDFDTLIEQILLGAKQLSNADGGTLYMLSKDEQNLHFRVVQTDSLGIKMGGTSGIITWPDVKLFNDAGEKNLENVASVCAINGELINISDVYTETSFNFEGTKKFDLGTGYRTKSMLVVPMTNHENTVIGVLQLLNKQDQNDNTIEFTKSDEKLISSMSSQAAVSITNTRLIEGLEKLLMDFIKSTADAISEKSKYTGGHINRVAELANLIASSINESTEGIYKDNTFSKDDLQQIDIAGWMHDIGKITTPEFVVDKAKKLETIYDRIHTVIAKYEIVKRDLEIEFLKAKISSSDENQIKILEEKFLSTIKEIENDVAFLKVANKGSEFMSDEFEARIKEISLKTLMINNEKMSLLSEDELYNLSIRKGTLNDKERKVINNHVTVSYNMLSKLTFPKKLARVPLIAGSHHKTIYTDGNGRHGGYGAEEIMSEDMSLEDRILAVADVFEAVTASDRPYKDPNSLNQSLKILSYMVKDDELDRDLVKFFIDNKIYKSYVYDNLLESQIDEVTVEIP
jgi:HD-GYP domain-containing protein (c-di-GMP phosphodiesterase class II)/phosphoribosyl 1,2-cyclic phosphodiesterase